MGLLSKLFNSKEKINSNMNSFEDNFNFEEYKKYNDDRINEFKKRYDLTSIDGIKAITIQEAKRYPDGGKSVVYMPEQILNRQATEYKKEGKFELARECLKKANELYPVSFYTYTRDNYERLVDMMVLAGRYEEAKVEHEKLDRLHGTRLDEFHKLQKYAVESNTESFGSYQIRVIDPYIEESNEREQYYWLLENANKIAPKSFSGYRRMKKQNTENYQKIVLEVNKLGKNIDNLKFWN